MSTTLRVYGQFTSQGAGYQPNPAPVVNVAQVARANGAVTQTVTGAAVTAYVGDGFYVYLITGCDLTTYDYVARFVTTDTAADQLVSGALQQSVANVDVVAPGTGFTAVTNLAGGTGRNPSDMTTTINGQPRMGVVVQAYLALAYTANPATAAVIAETTSGVSGGWTLSLPSGATYVIVFVYSEFLSNTGSVTV